MSKSRARFLAELLGTDGLVKTSKSALAGADSIIDLDTLPSIPNSKLTNSSITINSNATSLGGSVTLTTANVAENTNLYYTNARADARIAAATTDDISEGSSNLYYTDARADARVALIVDSAPGTLNTLNELAAALGDDANFSTTVTNSIATKLPLAGGTMTGTLNMGANAITSTGTISSGAITSSGLITADRFKSGPGTAASPAFQVGDNDSGFYDSGNDSIGVALGGVKRYEFLVTQFNLQANDLVTQGVVQAGQGSATSPSFQVGDNDSGFYDSGANEIGVTLGGVDEYEFTPTQFDMTGNNLVTTGTISSGAITSSGTGTFEGGGSTLTLKKGTGTPSIAFAGTATDPQATALIEGISGGGLKIYTSSGTISSPSWSPKITLAANGNTTFAGTISSGRLSPTGIQMSVDTGLYNQNASLSYYAASNAVYLNGAGPSGWLRLNAAGTENDTNAINIFGSNNGANITFRTAGTQRMNIDSSGNLRWGSANTAILDPSRNLTNIGTISSGAITSSSGITATGPFKSGGSNNYILFDYDGDFTGGNYYAIQDTSANRLRISYGFSATDNLELDASGNFYVNGGNATIAGTISSGAITSSGAVTATSLSLSNGYAFINAGDTSNTTLEPVLWARSQVGASVVQLNVQGDQWQFGGGGTLDTTPTMIIDYGSNIVTVDGTAHFKGGILKIGTADSSSGHLNAYELMSFNIDSDNDDTNRHFAWYKNGESASGTEMMKLDEDNLLSLSGTALVENAKLKAIAESNSDTARDVFVYDTRKDSDGGAWRKRTQNTSWYNETLNTSTRGARKEFPSVAVIVYEEDQLTIYDGDDPDMPMWMVINAGGGHPLYAGGPSNTCEALNGELIAGCGSASVAGALSHFNFIGDLGYLRVNTSSSYNAVAIINRNTGFSSDTIIGTTEALVNRSINDVAMTVLPNAPIDADTGLPVPTIAVATNGGVSVIKDDGTVVDSGYTSNASTVAFCGSDAPYLVYGRSEFGQDRVYESGDFLTEGFGNLQYSNSNIFGSHNNPNVSAYSNDGWAFGTKEGSPLAYKSGAGLWLLEKPSTFSSKVDERGDLFSHISYDYNTGWMHGDIKLATLSDTDTTNNPELITNGTFASGVTGWATDGGSIAWNGSGDQTATVTSNGSSIWNGATQTLTGLVVGKTYILTADIITSSNWGSIGFSAGPGSANRYGSYTSWNGGSTFPIKAKAQFTATATSVTVTIDSLNTTNATVTKVDNISVRIAAVDHSVNNNALQTFGTVTKTAVATGAELVGYSGFSSSNYLQQPYNADLQFGTGDFSIACWVKAGTANAYRRFISIQDPTGSQNNDDAINIKYAPPSGGFIYAYLGTSEGSITTAANIPANLWQQVILVRSSGTYYLYLDGTLASTKASTQSKGSTSHVLRVGLGAEGNESFSDGSIALVRISATAPSEEQIIKMYNDEKHLFQTNAKATLYGTSDAVTALAYDDDTELLHVGTSAGRSVFQGLNRVDNTTDAVGTSISASNGFIVEE